MESQTYQAALDCLLNRETSRPSVLFARRICARMLHVPATGAQLQPVFTRMNGYHPGWYLTGKPQDGTLRVPVSQPPVLPERSVMLKNMEHAASAVSQDEAHLGQLLDVLEQYGAAIAAADDISEFDYRRMTAAAAVCAEEFPGQPDDQSDVFLLYTADFSGIQKFIYTVSTTNALKALRSRSFFLELTMEHYIDELLCACGLSRVNLLYSGGGHCYLLLPNTEAVRTAVTQWNTRFNDWLCADFGTSVYLADGYTPCSANDLTNTPAEEAPYRAMFRRLSSAVSRKKICRYTPQQIRNLNRREQASGQRECLVCGTQSNLKTDRDGRSLCKWCSFFENLSSKILQSEVILVCEGSQEGAAFPTIKGSGSLVFCTRAEAREYAAEQILRAYGKNRFPDALPNGIRLFVGDYAADNRMKELALASEGIPRIGVCRMDVDNLGQSFVAGFEQESDDPKVRQQYVNLIRTSTFSRQMSLFFKGYINQILSGEFEQQRPLAVAVVYSGGDDVFLLGAWTDVMEAALRLRNAFRRYCCGALTLSAGICLFKDGHPIRLAANQTALLEDEAKSLPAKDGISIFAAEQGHVYTWADFETKVLGEKLALLRRFFADSDTHGNTFLYHIYALLQESNACSGKGIPLARLAYLLARLCPPENSPIRPVYEEFHQKVYQWSLDVEQRSQLITAICLYVYQTRKVCDENG